MGLSLFCILWAVFTVHGAIPVAFPLRVSPNGHYLEDQQGRPFLIHGDAAWAMLAALTREEMEVYLEDRRSKGFNAIIVMLICSHPSVHDGAMTNRYGEPPFFGNVDFAQPNESYFELADWLVGRAAEKNMLLLLAPCYVGFGEQDAWQLQMITNGVKKCRAYGDFIGRRYRDATNILWVQYGDNGDLNYLPYVRVIARAIEQQAPNQLQTAKLWPEQSSRDLLEKQSWLDVNATYAYGSLWNYKRKVHDKALEDYKRAPAMPAFLIESTYENEHDSTTQWVRRQAYGALLSGSAGQCMGSYPIWAFTKGWKSALDGAASQSMAHLKCLFDSRPWSTFVPDENHEVVSRGYGSRNTDDYVVVARSRNGETAMAYLPVGRKITVNLACVQGEAAAVWWYNPRIGKASNVGEFATSGSRRFSPADKEDWVLVVDSVAKGYPAPGTQKDPK